MRRLIVLTTATLVVGSLATPVDAQVVGEPTPGADTTVIGNGARWHYSDIGRRPAARWQSPARSVPSWRSGPAPFGSGYRRVTTKLAPGRSTYYFRTSFRLADSLAVTGLRLRAQIADGAVVYLNGSPIWRFNISANPDPRTRAKRTVNRPGHWRTAAVPTDAVRAGRNVVAVELHDHSRPPRDVRFDLSLTAHLVPADQDPVAPPTPAPTSTPNPTATPTPEPTPAPVEPAPAPPVVVDPSTEPIDTAPRVMCEINDPRLPEISGLASSVRHDGIVWTHNDSGDSARIFAVDVTTCAMRAVVVLSGITARDIEAIGMGRDPTGDPELWVADVGDNGLSRAHVQLYHFAEPAQLTDQSVAVETVTVNWTEGPRNCETILVDPIANGDIYLVSKATVGEVYRLGGPYRISGTATTGSPIARVGSTVTDGAVAPDRSMTALRYYTDAQLMTGVPGTDPRVLAVPAQRQGEAITFTSDSRYVYIASERVTDLIRVPVVGR